MNNQLVIPIGTVDVPSTKKSFIAETHFVKNITKNAPVKIAYLGDDFKAYFVGMPGWAFAKEEKPFKGSILCYGELSYSSLDSYIITELGGEQKAETTLYELFSLLQIQPNGESGVLLTDLTKKLCNAFYIKDIRGRLLPVSAFWNGKGWDMSTYPSYKWSVGTRFFFRKIH